MTESASGKVTHRTLRRMKERGERIVAVTAYDFPMARLEDEAGVEVILVGDSLGQVVLGYPNTLPVTLEDMIHHARAVSRAAPRALVAVDMPFMSFQVSAAEALRSAGRLVKEGNAEAVKLEGGERIVPQVEAIVGAGIPCMGHLGLTPQSLLSFGGYRVQGRAQEEEERLSRDAALLEEAGCFAIVLEAIPWPLAQRITGERGIPTIGIGAGPHCDGQVLVAHDLLGVCEDFTPRFVKRYATLAQEMRDAFRRYAMEVRAGIFPDLERSYSSREGRDSAPGELPRRGAKRAANGRKK